MDSFHAQSPYDLSVQPPSHYHLVKARVGEPKFLKPEGFSLGDIINLPIKRNLSVVGTHVWEYGGMELIISKHYVF